MSALVPVSVECYAGSRAAESPRAVSVAGRRREVEEIVDRWYEGGVDPTRPRIEYFRVRLGDGSRMLLRYEPASHVWFLVA